METTRTTTVIHLSGLGLAGEKGKRQEIDSDVEEEEIADDRNAGEHQQGPPLLEKSNHDEEGIVTTEQEMSGICNIAMQMHPIRQAV